MKLLLSIIFALLSPLLLHTQPNTIYHWEVEGRAFLGMNEDAMFYRKGKHIYRLNHDESKAQQVFELNKELQECPEIAIKGDLMILIDSYDIFAYNWKTQKLLWKKEYESSWRPQCDPQFYGDYVTVSFDDLILIYNAQNGALVFSFEDEDLECDVTIIGDHVFFSHFESGEVHCYDFKKNQHRWSKVVGDTPGFGVTHDGAQVILPSWEAFLYGVDLKTGKENWKIDMNEIKTGCGSGFEEAPPVYGEEFFAPHRDEGFFVFNKNTGALVRQLEVDDDIISGAVIYKDIVWFSSNTEVYGYNPQTKDFKYRQPLGGEYPAEIYLSGHYLLIKDYDNDRKSTRFVRVDLDQIMQP